MPIEESALHVVSQGGIEFTVPMEASANKSTSERRAGVWTLRNLAWKAQLIADLKRTIAADESVRSTRLLAR